MKLISIGTDRNLFKEGSSVRERQVEYGKLFDELHIVVFTRRGFPKKVQLSSNVWVYSTNSFFKLTYMRRAVRLVGAIVKDRKLSPTDTVITTQDPFESGIVGRKVKKKYGLPLHVQIHTDFLSPFFSHSVLNKIRVRIAKGVLARADGVRVVSQRITDSLGGLLSPGVVPVVLPIFVDVVAFKNGPVNADLKQKYPQFNFIILMASRLTTEKNIPFALRAFKRVVEIYPKAGLVIVGDGPEKPKLITLSKKLGLEKGVVFEGWQKDLSSYYKTANLFLLTSNYEGYGLTLIESVAAHCPVVSTDVGVANILLQDGISLVCPVGDMNCFVQKIKMLIEDTGLRLNFAQEAESRLEKVVSLDKSTFLEVYRTNIESVIRK